MFPNIYDKGYFVRFVERAKSELGQKIYKCRWDFIQRHLKSGSLLDYGCGPGVFHKSGPASFETYGFDINPHCGFSTIQYREHWDAVTFCDSLEHIPNFYETIKRFNPDWLFIICPNVENVNGPIAAWKHYRPGEHIYYFDRHSLKVILESLGYKIKEISFEEGALRDPDNPEAVISVAAHKESI